jgi:hypothetical protein
VRGGRAGRRRGSVNPDLVWVSGGGGCSVPQSSGAVGSASACSAVGEVEQGYFVSWLAGPVPPSSLHSLEHHASDWRGKQPLLRPKPSPCCSLQVDFLFPNNLLHGWEFPSFSRSKE